MLVARDLAFSYRPGSPELFGGLTHAFAPGAVTVMTGASGRGKSTLLYILGLLLRPTRGSVDLAGRSLGGEPDARRARLRGRHIGFVFQDAVLDPSRTVLDSVCEPALYAGRSRADARTRALELLQRMGVDAPADRRPGEISGGQAQRVAVCRALVNDPLVVLADEPTGNLDRANAAGVLDALASVATARRTVVIASHDPYVLERADEVLSL